MNIIFLDFNGVLDTNENMDEIDRENLLRLKRITEETNSKIVISSSIKNGYMMTGKKGKMLNYLLSTLESESIEVIGFTPHLDSREEEIKKYLEEHGEIENFCILDDDYYMESFKDNLVKLPCQIEIGQTGLTDYHMNLAIEILTKDNNKKLCLMKKNK